MAVEGTPIFALDAAGIQAIVPYTELVSKLTWEEIDQFRAELAEMVKNAT